MDCIFISLRGKSKALVEVQAEGDLEDPEDDRLSEDNIRALFMEFIERAGVIVTLKSNKDLDIYLGLRATQMSFEIPKEFFEFVNQTGLEVSFGLN